MSNTYNGWTNYATWRINLEIFDGTSMEDMSWDGFSDAYELGQELQQYAEEVVFGFDRKSSLAESYASAFMGDVNWTEIASSLIETYKDEVNS
jgi:hypothetical protein